MLEPDTGNLLAAANDAISLGVTRLREQGKTGLVVLMDDLDKMVVREHSGTRCGTDEYLFVHRAAQLKAFACHVVYTMPLSLAYSHLGQTIRSNFGGHVPVLPMTKIAERPPHRTRYALGMQRFREIVGKRLKEANAEEQNVFSSERVRDDLISLSGGQPIELMALVREALVTHGLPIDESSIERALREGKKEYARQLRADHWPIIKDIAKTGGYTPATRDERAFRELLESRAVLQYDNDDQWYALNPMVDALVPPGKHIPPV
jgi:hypothetical protein